MKKLMLIVIALGFMSTANASVIACKQFLSMKDSDAANYVKQQVKAAAKGKSTEIDTFTESQLLMTGYVLFCNK